MRLNQYTSVAHATRALRKRGFKYDFKLEDRKWMRNLGNKKKYKPSDMTIVEYHRFEGMSNPSDLSIVFAVETHNGDKGIIVSSYGVYADMDLVEFMDKVKVKERVAA
jgi:hypothetical protein